MIIVPYIWVWVRDYKLLASTVLFTRKLLARTVLFTRKLLARTVLFTRKLLARDNFHAREFRVPARNTRVTSTRRASFFQLTRGRYCTLREYSPLSTRYRNDDDDLAGREVRRGLGELSGWHVVGVYFYIY